MNDDFYTREEKEAILQATNESKPWDSNHIKILKGRIKEHHQNIQKKLCCYCQRDTLDEFTYVLDIEHILPKSKYPKHTFDIWNLSVSCKRCNMQIKGQKIDFLVDQSFLTSKVNDSNSYRFIHPNFDFKENHLKRLVYQICEQRIVVYDIVGNSEKGKYTYTYFQLKSFEINSFDHAQNPEKKPQSSEFIDLVNKINQ